MWVEKSHMSLLHNYTKNGAEAVLPLRRDIAEMLTEWLVNKPAGNNTYSLAIFYAAQRP